jgi:2-succinyl-5-enolpyruvyl-6-hydroxy-3-cyclohexene-1-carboxylate synthase
MHALLASLAHAAAESGVRHAVICPGSRSAPLVIAFARNPNFRQHVISDERSAGFIALGLAQRTQAPVVLICTSGTAAYHFAPAVAEAFYQQIPLLVLTADRPPAWIDQADGQTIRQENLFGRHVRQSWNLPPDYAHPETQWHVQRVWNEALMLAAGETPGPVHINFPFREPLYPTPHENTEPVAGRTTTRLASAAAFAEAPLRALHRQLAAAGRVLVVAGQQRRSQALQQVLEHFSEKFQTVVAGDLTGNVHGVPGIIRLADAFLAPQNEEVKSTLRPDLLITFGLSTVSKNLKTFLRRFRPAAHWHVQPAGIAPDTFQSLTQVIACAPEFFFHTLAHTAEVSDNAARTAFRKNWRRLELRTQQLTDRFFEQTETGEFAAVRRMLMALPPGSALHLANSMPVRYANLAGLPINGNIEIFANRGTSGIDGCTSTAVGHCMAGSGLQVLLTGDVAFFYDSNAFWHDEDLSDLRIVLLNNQGGVIFGMIDGPAGLPELDRFFITRQKRRARHLCEEFGIRYQRYESPNQWPDFFQSPGPSLMEVETTSDISRNIYQQYKQFIQSSTYEPQIPLDAS